MHSLDILADLIAFRHSLYSCFGRRADALFELTDAILAAGPSPRSPTCLRVLFARHALADEPVRVCGVGCSVWARCDAEATSERG